MNIPRVAIETAVEDTAAIYESALEGDFPRTIISTLSARIPGAAILLYGQDTAELQGNFLLQNGLGEDADRLFMLSLSVRNAWFAKHWEQAVGRVYHDRELLDRASFMETRFYQEWLSKWGELTGAVGVVLCRKGSRQLVAEIRFPAADQGTTMPAAREILGRLAPHFVTAAKVFDRWHGEPHPSDNISELLDLYPFPTFIVDSACRVTASNYKATVIANRMESLFVSADDVLYAVDQLSETDLKANVRKLASSAKSHSVFMPVTKTDGQSRQVLMLKTLRPSKPRNGVHGGYFSENDARIAVVAQQGGEPLRLSHDALWQSFGLTNKESELAASLVEGSTVCEHAARLRVSKQTLRNQLGSIMRKTDTCRQTQLVALLTRLAISSPD